MAAYAIELARNVTEDTVVSYRTYICFFMVLRCVGKFVGKLSAFKRETFLKEKPWDVQVTGEHPTPSH